MKHIAAPIVAVHNTKHHIQILKIRMPPITGLSIQLIHF